MMPRRLSRLLTLGTAVSVLNGCVDLVYEGRYSSMEGWRDGKVLEVGNQVGDHPTFFDCRKKESGRPFGQQFAFVEYRRSPGHRDGQIVPIGVGQELKPGDPVYIKIWDCRPAVLSGVTESR